MRSDVPKPQCGNLTVRMAGPYLLVLDLILIYIDWSRRLLGDVVVFSHFSEEELFGLVSPGLREPKDWVRSFI